MAEAPAVLTATQLRLLLRAVIDLDPFTFLDDLTEELADENEAAAPSK